MTVTPAGDDLDDQVTYTAGTVTIDDQDAATVSVDAVTLTEDGLGQNVTVRLTTAGTLENDLVVTLTPTGAEGASDYNTAVQTVTFTAGSGNNATQTISITPVDDALVEGNELVTVTPAGDDLDDQVTYTAGTVTIDDQDAATVSVDAVTRPRTGWVRT